MAVIYVGRKSTPCIRRGMGDVKACHVYTRHSIRISMPCITRGICCEFTSSSKRWEQSACPQAAAFLSRRTRIMPPTYVYTPFVSDLVLAKSVAVGKTPRQALLFDCLLYWPHIDAFTIEV